MKNNNLIQEEITRAKQLWGYDTSKTIFEQATGNTGTSNTCYAITQLAPCSGGTLYVGYANWCFSVNGAAGTQGDNGTVVTTNDGMTGTIQSTAPISNPTTNYIIPFTQTTCPTTGNTGTTLMGVTMDRCTGGTNFNSYFPVSINNINVTQGDVGKTILVDGGGLHGTILSVVSGTWPGYSQPVNFTEVPCGLPPGTGTTVGCNQSAWSGYQTWVNNWTTNNAFNSSNPNQPCNHICKKIQQWTMMSTGTVPLSPRQDNIVRCKLDTGHDAKTWKGCTC